MFRDQQSTIQELGPLWARQTVVRGAEQASLAQFRKCGESLKVWQVRDISRIITIKKKFMKKNHTSPVRKCMMPMLIFHCVRECLTVR